jgi:hypothetical protein
LPVTPDRNPGPLEEDEEIRLGTNPSGPSCEGACAYDGTSFKFWDGVGVFDPRTGGSGITADQHKILRQLIHFLVSGGPGGGFGVGPYYSETLPSADPFPTSETWYEDATKAKKIVRYEVTYNANKTHATETTIVYKSDGVNPAAQAVDTISYSAIFEIHRSRAVTVY